eukprot:CAMPEP_0173223698 /NCGR_PEP_ID=MMETSP1142-20121109/3929_1 /TAXON_ID=483371 /ORGANISM="non described non described, Strain CCMP2298" /LENGTH=60 /DNA_ID=CAMNT_0014151885 /DNA_START=167 /DNA_END=349 /DNA_ORIENTATION=-
MYHEIVASYHSGQSKVGYLDSTVAAGDEDVGRLEVAVDDVRAVDIRHGVHDLVHDESYVF